MLFFSRLVKQIFISISSLALPKGFLERCCLLALGLWKDKSKMTKKSKAAKQ